jgi:hypothetical protein
VILDILGQNDIFFERLKSFKIEDIIQVLTLTRSFSKHRIFKKCLNTLINRDNVYFYRFACSLNQQELNTLSSKMIEECIKREDYFKVGLLPVKAYLEWQKNNPNESILAHLIETENTFKKLISVASEGNFSFASVMPGKNETIFSYVMQYFNNKHFLEKVFSILDHDKTIGINTVDDHNNTILHYFIRNCDFYYLQNALWLFMEKGLDLTIVSDQHGTVVDYLNELKLASDITPEKLNIIKIAIKTINKHLGQDLKQPESIPKPMISNQDIRLLFKKIDALTTEVHELRKEVRELKLAKSVTLNEPKSQASHQFFG